MTACRRMKIRRTAPRRKILVISPRSSQIVLQTTATLPAASLCKKVKATPRRGLEVFSALSTALWPAVFRQHGSGEELLAKASTS